MMKVAAARAVDEVAAARAVDDAVAEVAVRVYLVRVGGLLLSGANARVPEE